MGGLCDLAHSCPVVSGSCVTFASIHPSRRREQCREAAAKGGPFMPEGYCVKERKKVEIKDAKQVTMKNGRPAIQGVCPDCGTKIFKIGKL
jgi:uncharacterized protein DUF5679